MASFPVGKFAAAVVNATATAANTNALATFNLDFSLYKVVQAPKEFFDVGIALSATRRQEAESGKVHKTARQLSALFEPLLPPTPKLEKAYGLRASEIAKASAAKEVDQKKDGVFAGRAGADATSIWAAATSGGGAIKVHLLACMLARLWEGSEATSIWVEIVAERKQEILATFESTDNIDIAAHQATLDDLERYRLAEWDASARAWLRTADLRKARQQTQLELVIRNLQIPVNSKPVLYESVLQAWKVALTGMENLLQGSPQQVQSGELLPGLAAWHLYPDMVVLSNSTKIIEQKDPHFGGGVLTFGLSGNTLSMKSGVHWSLPLAYLRYYGDPVIRTRAMTEDGSRLSADDLSKAVLGCVLEGWGSDGKDTLAASKFILDLSEKISEALSTDPQRSQAISKFQCSPLAFLAKAASELLSSQGAERRRSLQLILLGRRSADFLGPTCSEFGLLRSGFYLSLQSSPDEKISALRRLVKDLNVESEDIFIRYSRRVPETKQEVWECATALPIPRPSLKRTADRAEKIAEGHCRWIVTQLELAHSEPGNPEFLNKHFADRFQKQTLEYHTNMIHHGENLFAKEAEIISCRRENGEEIIYWYQPCRPLRLIKHGLTFDGLDYQRWVQDTNPGTRFEMLYGDMQAAVFVACPNQFDTPPNKPQLPPNAERSGIHHYLLNESLDSALFLQVCDRAFQSTGYDYMLSLQGFATAVQLYMLMPDASIDIRILEKRLSTAPWLESASELDVLRPIRKYERLINRAPHSQTFWNL